MSNYCDFAEQPNYAGQQPDAVIKLPEDRVIVIDAKAAAFLEAGQAEDPAAAGQA